jgi:hypothetical protein
MSFDRLAPHYRWMEWLLAGGKLQRCRTTFLAEVQHADRVLMLGEGNGRFLRAFARVNHLAQITVLDSSARMLQQAQRRMAIPAAEAGRIRFEHTDILVWGFPPEPFDLVVTNFFFDCFRPEQLAVLVPRIATASSADARWLLSDFHVPARGLAAWRARWIVGAMYCFFRALTGIAARTITPVDSLLKQSGFEMRDRRVTEWGLLHSDLWQRRANALEGQAA